MYRKSLQVDPQIFEFSNTQSLEPCSVFAHRPQLQTVLELGSFGVAGLCCRTALIFAAGNSLSLFGEVGPHV